MEIRSVADKLIEKRCVWNYSSDKRCLSKSKFIVSWAYNRGVSVCDDHSKKLKVATGYKKEKI